MTTIGIVTTSRADYGIYLPILRRLKGESDLKTELIVSGMHLSGDFGMTVDAIEADGFEVNHRVEMLLASDTPEGIGKSIGLGVSGFAQLFGTFHPDLLLVLGDRFEMFAAVVAALPFKIPVAHIHGGELSLGAIDDALRHSMTKMSHLHFVATQEAARRVIQLGEEAWRVVVSGAPSLDNIAALDDMTREELAVTSGLPVDGPYLLVTFHPVTLEWEHSREQASAVVDAISSSGLPCLITLPNADTGGRSVREVFTGAAARNSNLRPVDNLGTQAYFAAMRHASAMVGNSSSGIIEAASFQLPVVNVGSRQAGRLRGSNVIDVGVTSQEIAQGIRRALGADFRDSLSGMSNPYGDGHASGRIVETMKSVDFKLLLPKGFHDLDPEQGSSRE